MLTFYLLVGIPLFVFGMSYAIRACLQAFLWYYETRLAIETKRYERKKAYHDRMLKLQQETQALLERIRSGNQA